MRTTHAPALVAAGFLLLAPVAHAAEKDLFHPGFASVMVGAYFPKSPDLNDGVALLLAMGLMVNPYVGFQLDCVGLSTSDDHDFSVTIDVVLRIPQTRRPCQLRRTIRPRRRGDRL